jgi:hypothetical protein
MVYDYPLRGGAVLLLRRVPLEDAAGTVSDAAARAASVLGARA